MTSKPIKKESNRQLQATRKGEHGRRGGAGAGTPKFSGECDDLKGFTFDATTGRDPEGYRKSMERFVSYIGTSMSQYPGDIEFLIENLEDPKIKAPMAPPRDAQGNRDETETELWKIRLKNHSAREIALETNKQKAFALLWGQCTSAMRAQLKEDDSWREVRADHDVIKMVKLIRSAMYNVETKTYLPESLELALTGYVNHFQRRNESNADYQERFLNLIEVYEQHGGDIVHKGLIENELKIINPGITLKNADIYIDEYKAARKEARAK